MRKVMFFLAFLLAAGGINAQSTTPFTFNSTGGSFDDANSYYRFEWSVSEMTMINTINTADSSCRLLHGVLQPGTEKPAYPMTLLFEAGDYRLFPNPTPDKFELNFFVTTPGRMELQLTDAMGRVLEKRSYDYDGVRRIELFNLGKYANGLYYVIATLTPISNRGFDNINIVRRSGLKVIKLQ